MPEIPNADLQPLFGGAQIIETAPKLSHLPFYVRQAGALCFRDGPQAQEILLVMSLRNGRWGIPKGHIEFGETTHQTAQREAFEEAGVWGIPEGDVLGSYIYEKEGRSNRYHVSVHLMQVIGLSETFPEKHIRKRRWVSIETAINETTYAGLRTVLERFVFLARDQDHTSSR